MGTASKGSTERAMKKSLHTKLISVLGLIAVVALVPGLTPTPVWAVVDCTPFLLAEATDPGTDADNDGFTDFQECNGITLGTTTIPLCSGLMARRACVDPDSKDVFVALVRTVTPPSLLSAPFDPVFNSTSTFDPFAGLTPLGVTPHVVPPELLGSGRQVTATQKAIKFTESQNTNVDYVGICNYGTPLDLDGCVIYTLKAKNFIDSVCNSAGDTRLECFVYVAYWTWIIQHEGGHTLGGLVDQSLYNARFGGYHYKCGSNVTMEQCVTYTTKNNIVTWKIPPAAWTDSDTANLLLK
ncbi:MAG: hypothetical protein HYY64_13745 [Candidatus Rokubacteria bacterium]|nr:hypothetical protein [Candidatus Rokubacteria bacterium]